MKKSYLHIGMSKTGSTAIQKFCRENLHFLADNDIVFPLITKGSYLDGYYLTVFIYGYGYAGTTLINLLHVQDDLNIFGFTVSEAFEGERKLYEYDVIPYSKIENKQDYMCIIATVNETFKEEIKTRFTVDGIHDYYSL